MGFYVEITFDAAAEPVAFGLACEESRDSVCQCRNVPFWYEQSGVAIPDGLRNRRMRWCNSNDACSGRLQEDNGEPLSVAIVSCHAGYHEYGCSSHPFENISARAAAEEVDPLPHTHFSGEPFEAWPKGPIAYHHEPRLGVSVGDLAESLEKVARPVLWHEAANMQ